MRFNVTLICLIAAASFGQEPIVEPSDHSVVRGTQSEKRAIVDRWIALEWPDHVDWRGKIVDANSIITIIVNTNVWAQETLIAEIDRIKPARGNQDAAVIRLGMLLSGVSTPLTYEAMRSRFHDHQDYRFMIKTLIRQNLDTRTSYPLSVWYLALRPICFMLDWQEARRAFSRTF